MATALVIFRSGEAVPVPQGKINKNWHNCLTVDLGLSTLNIKHSNEIFWLYFLYCYFNYTVLVYAFVFCITLFQSL